LFKNNTQVIKEIVEQHELWIASLGKKGSRADFYKKHLMTIDFSNCNLYASLFINTNLLEADFTESNLKKAIMVGSWLKRVNFHNANLSNADLTGGWAVDSDFTGADLAYADFSRVNVEGSDFTGARLYKTIFFNAMNLNKAIFDSKQMGYISTFIK
jgi:uncharacterized protein YjbI with pentapeptide repeats